MKNLFQIWWAYNRGDYNRDFMVFYHPKWNFISVKVTDMKPIPALSFKGICALIATSNESALIHFVSGKLCSHENLMTVRNDRYEIHTVLGFISPQFLWTQVKSWLNTEVRFSTETKSHTGWSSFHLSFERILNAYKSWVIYYLLNLPPSPLILFSETTANVLLSEQLERN